MLFSVVIDDLRWTDEPQIRRARAIESNQIAKLTLVLERILLFFGRTQDQDGQKVALDEKTGTRGAIVAGFISKSEMTVSFANVRVKMRNACVGTKRECGKAEIADARNVRRVVCGRENLKACRSRRSGGCDTHCESGGAIEPAHRAELRTRKRAHQQRHGLGHTAAIEFHVQASEIAAAIDIDCMHAERAANQTMQRAASELCFARGNAHDQLHCRAMGCRVKGLARIVQRENGPRRGDGAGTAGIRAWRDDRRHTCCAHAVVRGGALELNTNRF
ncbi:hypothetical protein [Paraburkholderia ferrariae]|uniref:Uncharacterized protein n=1 Tax=Paraburkholderia ferrariae TaxID=386056 RepID=A0ABU9RMZ2_9BURK